MPLTPLEPLDLKEMIGFESRKAYCTTAAELGPLKWKYMSKDYRVSWADAMDSGARFALTGTKLLDIPDSEPINSNGKSAAEVAFNDLGHDREWGDVAETERAAWTSAVIVATQLLIVSSALQWTVYGRNLRYAVAVSETR